MDSRVESKPEPERDDPRRRRQWASVVSAVCLVLLVLGAAAGGGFAIHDKQHSDYCGHQSGLISDVLNVAEYDHENYSSSGTIPVSVSRQFSASDSRWVNSQITNVLDKAPNNVSSAYYAVRGAFLLRKGC